MRAFFYESLTSGSGIGGSTGALGRTVAPPSGVVAPETPEVPTGVPGPQRDRTMSGSMKNSEVGIFVMPMDAAIRTRAG